jgi:hypothetical protein
MRPGTALGILLTAVSCLACAAALAGEPAGSDKHARVVKEIQRRAKFFNEAKSPLSTLDVTGWLAGSYYPLDPAAKEYRQEHMILVGRAAKSLKLVPFSWPMGEGPSPQPEEGRLGKIAAALPAESRRCRAPVFGPKEIVFEGPDQSVWRIRKFGEDLFMKVEGGPNPGYAVLTEKMVPPKP